MNGDSRSVYISGKSASQDNYKCKSCGFIAFGEEPERAKYKKCLGCGNIMGETAPEKKTTVYKSHTFEDDERKKTIKGNTNSLLVTCGSCSHNFSKRAEKCPKCGWRPLAICHVCREKIPDDSISCPECGDPRPFELQEKTKQTTASPNEIKATGGLCLKSTPPPVDELTNEQKKIENKPQHKGFSWKSFLVAFVIAAFLNAFISAAAGVEPRKNIAWTAFWIYLSIESWKYWKWKALLPYPLFLVVTFALQAIVASTGNERLSWAYISVMLVSNIGGLAIFYMLFRKSQKQAHGITY